MAKSGFESGGNKAKAFIKKAKAAQRKGNPEIEVGFYATTRYSPVRQGKRGGQKRTPHPVTVVAAWNEFGTRNKDGSVATPERPFFRNAIEEAKRRLPNLVASLVDPATLQLSEQDAARIGEFVKGLIQESIINLRTPPNAPTTIKLKGSDNPLVDEGVMLRAVTYKIKGS